MIQRTKIKHIHGAAAIVVLGGLLITAVSVQAQPNDALPSASGSVGDNARDISGVGIGTAVGSPSSSATATATANQNATVDQTVLDEQTGIPVKQVSTAAKILDAISKHPTGREVKVQSWKIEQDKAVVAARAGQYEQAIPTLDRLHQDHPEDFSIAADRAAILAWAGRDADAVAAYKALPATGTRPDYLIDAVGHACRNLHQPEDALAIYRLGLQNFPDNQSFMGGEILSLLEAKHLDEAVAHAQAASNKIPVPTEPLAVAIKQVFHTNAVTLARNGHYKEALEAFVSLHERYPSDADITGDYVAVLSWAGHDTEAVAMYRSLPQTGVGSEQPDYVLDAAAHSYRNLHQSKEALALYQAALDKSPDNVVYAVGVIYSLADLGRSEEALKIAKAQLEKHPEKPVELVKAYIYVERHRAIDLARAGHYEQALTLLRQLRAKYPNDATEVMDYIAVSSWAGHDKDAVQEYQKIARQPMPDYVLEAVGHSYRALHQSEKALAVYRRGARQSPRNEVFAAGEIRCLDDLGRYAEGEKRAKEFFHAYGPHLDVLLAGGEAANFNDDPVEALNFYQRAAAIAPRNGEALRGLIHAEDRSGAPHLALSHAARHPGALNGQEYRALVGNADARLVRWGSLEPGSEDTRYAETDQALATLNAHIDAWKAKNDPASYPDIVRARFDRLTALRDRSRMQDVVDDYNALVQEGVEFPAYALVPVGDAYLYLRQPEIARDIFLKVLESDPANFEARRLLAYAYLESEQYDQAYTTIDKLVADEPKWIYLKGEPERQPNPELATAQIDAGQMRSFGGMQGDAHAMLQPLADAAPQDARNRAVLGNLFMARGWPRQALEQYQIGQSIQGGRDVANETGAAEAKLDLQDFKQAETEINNLAVRYPENLGVQRAARALEVHNMAELDAHAGYDFAPSQGSTGSANSPHGQGFSVGAELYSAPIAYNWRLFAGQDFTHEHQPNAEGIVDYTRTNAGVEYRKDDVTASVAPTFNAYNGRERVGIDGKAHYTFNDIWSAGIGAALFSSATPLRALNTGVTANQYDATVQWRQSDERVANLTASAMTFSDGNLRTMQNADYIERLYTDPNFRLDAEGDLGLSQNSKDENRLYFNPSQDLMALAGLRLTGTIYRRYETLYEHSLLAMPGLYAQQHYGTSPAWTVRYEHRLHYNDTLNAGAGINYTHQNYDGSAQDAVSLTMDVVERF